MLHYIPRSVQIPADSKLGRVFPKNVTRRGKTVALDVKTIFYDVIFLRRENCVLGLGPPLFNLKNELFPAKVLVDGKSVKFQIEEGKRQFFFRSEKLSFTPQNVLQVTFCFRHFESKVNVNIAHIDCAELENDRKLSISTLQKDNNLEWIKDWILWHSRLYKVTQVILYDNGSVNQKGLVSMLKSLRSEVNIVFVEWGFIYGVSPYFCAQIGALNHCRLMFGASNGDVNRYCINLDIDEYLVYLVSGGRNLKDYLDSAIGNSLNLAVHLQEMRVPNVLPNQAVKIPRIFDFGYRYRSFGSNPAAVPKHARNTHYRKYIYRFSDDFYNLVHSIEPFAFRITSYLEFKRFIFCLKTKLTRKIWRLRQITKMGEVRYPNINYQMLRAPIDDIYFWHFRGLRDEVNQDEDTKYDNRLHVAEPLISYLATKARLKESGTESYRN